MSPAPTLVIVPVKALGDAKQRLAGVLPLEARRRLMLVMLGDVLATLSQVETLHPILVVTPDAEAAEAAHSHGAQVLREPRGTGHSAAVVAGFAEARAHGAAQALTLPADVPLVSPSELHVLLQRSAARSPSPRLRGEGRGEGRPHAPCVTLVPSRDGDGTNGLLVSPPGALTPRFGPGSFARHRAQAAASGIACRTLGLPGLGLDIDEPADLHELMRLTRADPRYAFLEDYALLPAGAAEP